MAGLRLNNRVKFGLLCFLTTLVATGCCGVFPFKKCPTGGSIRVIWSSKSMCNGGYPVEVKYYLVTDTTELVIAKISDLFKYSATSGAGLIQQESRFHQPAAEDTVRFSYDYAADWKYVAIIANFGRPGNVGDSRNFVRIPDRGGQISIRLLCNESRLEAIEPETKN